ncbi:cell adhesion molecule 2, partial [Biomphalaria glabrata]
DRVTLSSDVSLSDRTISSTLSIKRGNMTDAGTYICRTPGNLVTSAKVNILN